MKTRSIYFVLTGALGGLVGFLAMELLRLDAGGAGGTGGADWMDAAVQFAGFGLAVGAALGATEGLFYRKRATMARGLLLGGVLGVLGGFGGGALGQKIFDLVPVRYVSQSQVDIAIALDSSGSMGGLLLFGNDPLDRRLSASKKLVERLSTRDRVAVVDFDDQARLVLPLTTLDSKAAVRRAERAIDGIDSAGGTHLTAGLRTALEALSAHRHPERPQHLVFLTDGVGEYDAAVEAEASAAGVVVHTVGLGSEVDESILRGLAEATGGGYYPASDASKLITIFETIFTETSGMASSRGAGTEGAEMRTSPWLLWLARVAAWAVMGLALGLGQGVRENTWVDLRACSRGGLLGGAIGGAAFDPLEIAAAGTFGVQAVVLSRLLGDVLVGALIGGSMRMAQVAADRRAQRRGVEKKPIVGGLRIASSDDSSKDLRR